MGVFEDNRRYRAVKTLIYLYILALMFVPICIWTKLKYYLFCRSKPRQKNNVKIVITGAKMYKSTLLVKWLGEAGYDIILLETEKFWCSGSRFSKYVSKFYTIPDAITKPKEYVKELVKICKENDAKIFIPACAPATEQLDAVVGNQLEQSGVKVLHAPLDVFEKLNDKHQFCQLMKSMNLAVPESFLVKSNEDVFNTNEILKQRI